MPEVAPLLPLLPAAVQSLLATPFEHFRDLVPHQLSLTFSQELPLSDTARLAILELLLNDGRHFEQLCEAALLYGAEPLPGLLLRTHACLFFAEGIRSSATGVSFAPIVASRALQSFYIAYLTAGHWGPPILFSGRPIVRWPLAEFIHVTPRFWLHKLSALELNFIAGWHCVLIPGAPHFTSLSTYSIQHITTLQFSGLCCSRGSFCRESISECEQHRDCDSLVRWPHTVECGGIIGLGKPCSRPRRRLSGD
jgi:hypothetical protein